MVHFVNSFNLPNLKKISKKNTTRLLPCFSPEAYRSSEGEKLPAIPLVCHGCDERDWVRLYHLRNEWLKWKPQIQDTPS